MPRPITDMMSVLDLYNDIVDAIGRNRDDDEFVKAAERGLEYADKLLDQAEQLELAFVNSNLEDLK